MRFHILRKRYLAQPSQSTERVLLLQLKVDIFAQRNFILKKVAMLVYNSYVIGVTSYEFSIISGN
jgi:hypothetical protein